MDLHYRYPGVKPFSQADTHLFFGRQQDIQQLVRYLRTESLVVLHGKSGLGKTSLIQAGVIPQLRGKGRQSLNITPIPFRFSSYNPRDPRNLSYIVERNIERPGNTFLDKLPVKYVSLWQALKARQLSDGGPQAKQEYLLIFDQFEELFTYPESEVQAFGHDLADVYNEVMPAEFRKVLRREEVVNPDLSAELAKPGMREWLESPLPVRMLIAIRSDKFNLLDGLSGYIPDILLNSRILEALNRDQAAEAITQPAIMEGQFDSPPFTYAPTALNQILDFLTSQNTRRVEGFQLQILCRNIEEKFIQFAKSDEARQDGRMVFHHEPTNGKYELASIDANFDDILRHYYDEQINTLSSPEAIQLARAFVEDELIADGRRVSMDRAAIKTKVSDELLNQLENARIIRREPNALGGFSYEISHDTLLDPILQARQERMLTEELRQKRAQAEEVERRRRLELEAEREARQRELDKAHAEKAEIEKQRALEAERAERRNKYFILTLLILVVAIASIITFSLIRESRQSERLEDQNQELTLARDSLQRQRDLLKKELGLNQSALDSLLDNYSQLPPEERQARRRTSEFDDIRRAIGDSVPQAKSFLRFDQLVVRMNVFPTGAPTIAERERQHLTAVAQILQRFPDYEIGIEVHSDRFGLARQNALITSNRAEEVLAVLGPVIDPPNEDKADLAGRIYLVGRGETDPISEDRNANRRVDLVISEKRRK